MSLLNMLTRRTRGRSSLVDLYAPGASEGDVLTVGADGSLSPAAPGGGGSQPLQLLGPFTATGNMAGIDTDGVVLAELDAGTIILQGFIVVTEQFDGNTSGVNLGVGATIVGADWQNITTVQNTVIGNPTGAVLFNPPTGGGTIATKGAKMTSNGVLVASLLTYEPPVTDGSADFYALAHIPA